MIKEPNFEAIMNEMFAPSEEDQEFDMLMDEVLIKPIEEQERKDQEFDMLMDEVLIKPIEEQERKDQEFDKFLDATVSYWRIKNLM